MADVRIEGISKYFGDFGAVKEVSTVFEEGTVTVSRSVWVWQDDTHAHDRRPGNADHGKRHDR